MKRVVYIVLLALVLSVNASALIMAPFLKSLVEVEGVQNQVTTLGESVAKSTLRAFLKTGALDTAREKPEEFYKKVVDQAEESGTLDEVQEILETKIKEGKATPAILFTLSMVYERKGMKREAYKALEKAEKEAKKHPQIAFNLTLVYGRKETLKSEIDKAESEAFALTHGSIEVKSDPAGAEVYIDGKKRGETPVTVEGVAEGKHQISIKKSDYKEEILEAEVHGQETTGISRELALLPGELEITSEPAGSTVVMNGEEVGVTPLKLEELKPGKYELVLKKNNYEDKIINLEIKPGKTVSVEKDLIPHPGSVLVVNFLSGSILYIDDNRVYPEYLTNGNAVVIKDIKPGNHKIKIKKENYITVEKNIFIEPEERIEVEGELEEESAYKQSSFGNALCLDGNGDYGKIAYSSKLNLRNEITIEAWIYVKSFSDKPGDGEGTWGYRNPQPVISQCHNGSSAGNYTFGLTSNKIFFVFETIDSRFEGKYNFEPGKWYHIAVVHKYKHGSDTRFYIDGKELRGKWMDDTGTPISGNELPLENSKNPYFVGSFDPGRLKVFFNGYIDELRVWRMVKSKSEIMSSMKNEISPESKGLVLYYRFNTEGKRKVKDLANKKILYLKGDSVIK